MAEDASGSAAGREVRRNELRELNLKAWEEDGIDTDCEMELTVKTCLS